MKARLLSSALILSLALFAVSAGIAAPILSRSFYKAHVKALDLPRQTGWTQEEILGAYDDVMAFLLRGAPFGTGVLKWSPDGEAHFTDVRGLFQLDLWIFGVTAVSNALLLLLSRKLRPHRFGNRGPSFWAGAGVLVLFLLIGIWGAADFNRAFTVFHHIFFPGKTNWLFDPMTDQIILVLPEVFFRNCAILALGIILILCVVYLYFGRKRNNTLAH